MSTMTGLTLREVAEAKDHAADQAKAQLTAESTVEQLQQYAALVNEATEAWSTVNAENAHQATRPTITPANGTTPDGSGVVTPNGMTLLDAMAASPAIQEFWAGANRHIAPISIAGSLRDALKAKFSAREGARNALIWTGDTTTGAVVNNPQRLEGITDLVPNTQVSIRDLCTNLQTAENAIEWVVLTTKTYGAAVVPEAQTDAPIGAGPPVVTAQQGGLKPYGDFDLALRTVNVKTIAVLAAITEQAAMDSAQLMGLLRTFLLEDVARAESTQLITGNNSATQLAGLINGGWGIPTYAPGGATDMDAVLGAIGQINTAGFTPTAMLVNPADWHSTGFLLSKDGQNRYMVADPRASIDQLNQLWGLRVVTAPAVPVGTVIVGDFRQVVIFDRMQSKIEGTNSHNDHFQRNILDFRAEERIAVAVRVPAALRIVTPI
ncbi:MAG: phage major capsid protein [Candidatus Neomicrothrix subdominans]